MQNKYVGDIGDYGKLILLRSLVRHSRLRLGVVWCYVSGLDEKNQDGSKRQFLTYKGKHCLRHCDQELFDCFQQFEEEENRKIANLEPLIPASSFFNEGTDSVRRGEWHRRALRATKDNDIVFFDPDNGIATKIGRGGVSPKHVLLSELADYWQRDQSILIYHHLSRTPGGHDSEVMRIGSLMQERFTRSRIREFRFRRGNSRVLFLAIHPKHSNMLGRLPDDGPWLPLTITKGRWAKAYRAERPTPFVLAS